MNAKCRVNGNVCWMKSLTDSHNSIHTSMLRIGTIGTWENDKMFPTKECEKREIEKATAIIITSPSRLSQTSYTKVFQCHNGMLTKRISMKCHEMSVTHGGGSRVRWNVEWRREHANNTVSIDLHKYGDVSVIVIQIPNVTQQHSNIAKRRPLLQSENSQGIIDCYFEGGMLTRQQNTLPRSS